MGATLKLFSPKQIVSSTDLNTQGNAPTVPSLPVTKNIIKTITSRIDKPYGTDKNETNEKGTVGKVTEVKE